ncbi:hypothetical protein WT05_03705 [Burkholderia stagnalis]|nr:hypothetical protein WT05_03705 [Burkholderia stagnalis]
MLQPCAAAASELAAAPNPSALPLATTRAIRAARCSSLTTAGVIFGSDLQSQASSALVQLRAAGYEADSDFLQAPMWDSQAVPAAGATMRTPMQVRA